MARKTLIVLVAVLCGWGARGLAEDVVAPLTLRDAGNVVRGFAEFQNSEATRDELYVTTPNGHGVLPTGVKVRQGDKDSIIFRLDGAEETLGYHVAYIERRKGDSLYEVYGVFVVVTGPGPGGPGEPEPRLTWQADYSSGDRRLLAFVNDAVDLNVALSGDFTNDDYVTVKLLGAASALWSDEYDPSEAYAFTLTDEDEDPDDTGHVAFQSSQGTLGWVSSGEFCDIRYVSIRGTTAGLTKIHVTATGFDAIDAYAYVGDFEVFKGYRFLTIGSNEYKYMYFPAECTLNGRESTHFAVLKFASGLPDMPDPEDTQFPLVDVYLRDGDNLIPCIRLKRDGEAAAMFILPEEYSYWYYYDQGGWQAYVDEINAYQQELGAAGDQSLAGIRSALVTGINDNDGIDAGRYWLSPPITDTDPTSPMTYVLAIRPARPRNEGNAGTHPDQVNAADPDPIMTKPQDQVRAPAIGAAAKKGVVCPITITPITPLNAVTANRLFEARITFNEAWFNLYVNEAANKKGIQKTSIFDAYDADKDGDSVHVWASFRRKPNATTMNPSQWPEKYMVPCFLLRPPKQGEQVQDLEWRVRFSPPTITPAAGTQVWEMSVRIAAHHTRAPEQDPKPLDEQNKVNLHGHQTYYHLYGWNDPHVVTGYPQSNYHTGKYKDVSLPLAIGRYRCTTGNDEGPLKMPPSTAGTNRNYFRQLVRNGDAYTEKPYFLIGHAQPYGKTHDQMSTLIGRMQDAGMNYAYTHISPFEHMICHQKQKELWFKDDSNNPTDENIPTAWKAYAYYDQGRADHIDKLLSTFEDSNTGEGSGKPSVYTGLAIWQQVSLRQDFAWKARPGDPGANGLAVEPNTEVNLAKFMSADTTKSPWLWQLNYYRYVVARWGYSTRLATWYIVVEPDMIGVADALLAQWYPLVADSIKYFDWRKRPVSGFQVPYPSEGLPLTRAGAYNMTGQPGKPDLFTGYNTHDFWSVSAYPFIFYWWAPLPGFRHTYVNHNWAEAGYIGFPEWVNTPGAGVNRMALLFHYGSARMYNWSKNTWQAAAGDRRPRVIAEAGIANKDWLNRPVPDGTLASYIHFMAWAAFASGQGGTPLKWVDGSGFKDIDPQFCAYFTPLADLLKTRVTDWGEFSEFVKYTDAPCSDQEVMAFGLKKPDGKDFMIWVFDDSFDTAQNANWGKSNRSFAAPTANAKQNAEVTLTVAANGAYTVDEYNTWQGGVLHRRTETVTSVNNQIKVKVGTFRTANDAGNVLWDGADMLLVIRPSS